MAKYLGPKGKIARRLGFALAGSPKTQKILMRRPNKPGEHGGGRPGKLTEYGKLLLEKQKMRWSYGLLEKQFRLYYQRARRIKGNAGHNLLALLETRLDTMIFRLQLAPSIWSARQLVLHGHFLVNGRKVNIASYQVKPGMVISVREKSHNVAIIKDCLEGNHPNAPRMRVPYVEFNPSDMSGKLTRLPERDEIPIDVNERSVIEFYSR